MNKYFLFKVKQGKLKKLQEWCNFLMANKDGVKETLRYENASRELGVLFSVGDDLFVYGTTEFFDEPKQADSSVEINRKHKEIIQDCLTMIAKGQQLFDIKLD